MTRTPLLMWLTASAFSLLAADGSTSGSARDARRQQTFRTETNLVRLDVMATVNGRALTGLTADDFEVLDNGVPQRVRMMTTVDKVRVLLLLDVSGSIALGTKMQSLVTASHALLKSLGRDDEVSLMTFANRLSLEATAVRDPEVLEKKLLAASGHPAGETALWDALVAGLSLISSEEDRSLVLVLSDGLDTASWCDAQRVKQVARYGEAVVYAVTVPAARTLTIEETRPRTPEERSRLEAINRARASYVPKDLKEVVEQSGGELFPAGQGDELTNTFVSVLERFRARYLLAYEPTGVRHDDGWHELRVALKGRAATIRARSGYYATPRRAGN